MTDTGFHQLLTGDPAPTPGGTWPDATAPATVPRKKGVNIDDKAKAIPSVRRCQQATTVLRKAKAEPRVITPRAATVRGMYSVDAIAPKRPGKPVHMTTRTKISQTWLASHTGPMECSMRRRCLSPRGAGPATNSQKPAPKSAPPKRA